MPEYDDPDTANRQLATLLKEQRPDEAKKFLRDNNIRIINLNDMGLDDRAASNLAAVMRDPDTNLLEVNVVGNNISEAGLAELASTLHTPRSQITRYIATPQSPSPEASQNNFLDRFENRTASQDQPLNR